MERSYYTRHYVAVAVSNFGTVGNKTTALLLSSGLDTHGYKMVHLCNKVKHRTRYIHQLHGGTGPPTGGFLKSLERVILSTERVIYTYNATLIGMSKRVLNSLATT